MCKIDKHMPIFFFKDISLSGKLKNKNIKLRVNYISEVTFKIMINIVKCT